MRSRIVEFGDVIRGLLSTWLGRVALVLLVVQLAITIYVLTAYDYPKLAAEYMNPNLWTGRYPPHAPPCWAVGKRADRINLYFDTRKLKPYKEASIPFQQGIYLWNMTWLVKFTYRGDAPPSDTLILVKAFVPASAATARVTLLLVRPDGLSLPLVKNALVNPGSVSIVLGIGNNTPLSLSFVSTGSSIYLQLKRVLEEKYGNSVVSQLLRRFNLGQVIWVNSKGEVVKGEYRLYINLVIVGDREAARKAWVLGKLLTMPNCYGLMGTDSYGRPIALGILLGYPWAFVISFYVTVLTVLIGGFYGIIAGLASGWKGELLMRIVDIVYSIPLLPFLIAVIIASNSRSIWLILTIMVLLLWTGPVVVVRSMVLQIKEQPFIESAYAVGVSRLRIILRYIFPQVFPYLMTLMVLGIPDPILTEAALAFLGLSDPTIPTWGKMLEQAWNEHAVVNGWWWSFIFPGLALAIFCATFLMLGRALEPILSPRLRR